jgi:pyruvate/2-oxoglutarate dehydrogenase complex dihydrolipoamide acyltransferase (E2) component
MTEQADKRQRTLRRVFALGQATLKALGDNSHWEDVAELIDAVKIRGGLVLPGHTLDGHFYRRLVSSRDMTNAQVEHLHDQCVKHLTQLLGMDVNLLLGPRGEQAPPPQGEPKPSPARAAFPNSGKAPAAVDPRQSSAAGPRVDSSPRRDELAREFGTKMIAVARDPKTSVEEKVAVLNNSAALWHESLGPGYANMVTNVVAELIKAVEGQAAMKDVLAYVDARVRYWNPNPGV